MYCSSYALHRLIRNFDAKEAAGGLAERLHSTAGIIESAIQPTNMLADDGLLFAGQGLEYDSGRSNIDPFYLAGGAQLLVHDGNPNFVVREYDNAGSVCIATNRYLAGATFLEQWGLHIRSCDNDSGGRRRLTPDSVWLDGVSRVVGEFLVLSASTSAFPLAAPQ